MDFEFRMKTGFFETKIFNLLISKGKLVLSPQGSDHQLITIPEESILNITLEKKEKSIKMEIQTHEEIYQGLLGNTTVNEQLLSQLKKNINKKIYCEYEGGN